MPMIRIPAGTMIGVEPLDDPTDIAAVIIDEPLTVEARFYGGVGMLPVYEFDHDGHHCCVSCDPSIRVLEATHA